MLKEGPFTLWHQLLPDEFHESLIFFEKCLIWAKSVQVGVKALVHKRAQAEGVMVANFFGELWIEDDLRSIICEHLEDFPLYAKMG